MIGLLLTTQFILFTMEMPIFEADWSASLKSFLLQNLTIIWKDFVYVMPVRAVCLPINIALCDDHRELSDIFDHVSQPFRLQNSAKSEYPYVYNLCGIVWGLTLRAELRFENKSASCSIKTQLDSLWINSWVYPNVTHASREYDSLKTLKCFYRVIMLIKFLVYSTFKL